MPELPEVETIARRLRGGCGSEPPLVGRKILDVQVRHPTPVARPGPKAARARMIGCDFREISRRGKFVVCRLTRGFLLIHLRMSGDLQLLPSAAEVRKHDHVVWRLDGGWDLRFHDPRRFGRMWAVDDPAEILEGLGPEPLSAGFTAARLRAMLGARRRLLKPLLLDQTFIAGIGNIYADESLHRARLHPLRRSDSLHPEESGRLRRGIRAALRAGIARNGASIDWAFRGGEFQHSFRVYGREGEPCARCGSKIRRIVVGQRSTYFCPVCQPRRRR